MEHLYNFHDQVTGQFMMQASLAFFTRIAHLQPQGMIRIEEELNKTGTSECFFNGRGYFPDCRISTVPTGIAEEPSVIVNKFLALYTSDNGSVDWLGEWNTREEAQSNLDEKVRQSKPENDDDCIAAGWIVPTVGRNYINT